MWDLLILIVGTGMSLLVGGVVFAVNYKTKLGLIYGLTTLFLLVISIVNYLSLDVNINQLLMVRLVMASTTSAVICLYLLIVYLKSPDASMNRFRWFMLSFSVVVVLYNFSPLLFNDVVQGSPPNPIAGEFPYLFFMHFIVTLALGIGELILGVKNSSDAKYKSRMISVVMGILPTLLLAPLTGFILPQFFGMVDLVLLTPLYIMFFVVLIGYAIVRHGLFDIRVAVVRAVGYILSLSAMSAVYIAMAYGVSLVFFGGHISEGVGISSVNIILALMIAFVFQPIKTFFDKVTDKIFFRGDYDSDVFFKAFGKIISFDTDLNVLLKQSASYIHETLRSERVFFHIRGRGIFGVGGASRLRREIPDVDIKVMESYYRKFHDNTEVMVRELIESDEVRDVMASHRAQMALPLIVQGDSIGCLFIGDHRSRKYRNRDVTAIETVANELTIAVQNSLSVEEIRDLNESLKHKVAVATKDLRASNRQLHRLDETKNEFISMASHQLRTPLTSIKGYLDMVLQGDLGKVSNTQKTVLTEAYLSSERMVSLISDFLNVSRLQTGKFLIDKTECDLSKIIQEELKMMSVMADQRNLKIQVSMSKDIPAVNADAEKLRQVIVNMVDNAIYYSKPKTSIKVRLTYGDGEVKFTVKDTGIGVPKSEQSSLFTKFFRATNARNRRPDGTGIGLFLAKKVIRLHGGQIIFESAENKGSTFGFSLPVK